MIALALLAAGSAAWIAWFASRKARRGTRLILTALAAVVAALAVAMWLLTLRDEAPPNAQTVDPSEISPGRPKQSR